MSHITIQNDDKYAIDNERVRQAIRAVIDRHDVDAHSAITVVITSDEVVQGLNKQHRGIDAPTDVLSFPAEPLPEALQADDESYLGDLLIAYPYASQQATQLGHDIDESLCLLAVHGTLHLLGYDHDTPEQRAEMWVEQAEILASLAIDDRIIPALEDSDHG